MKNLSLFALLAAMSLTLYGCTNSSDPGSTGGTGGAGETTISADAPKVAYVTNGIASFWVIAEKGAMDAGKEFGADVTVRMPPNGVEDQKRMCQDLLAQGIDGIAISPIDSANQGDLLDEISEHTKMITHDSDAPDSKRLCYVGMDNYSAGRMCGQLVKEAMPDDGSIMIFVGRLGQANARLRRQGVIDEVLGRSEDSSRYDDPNDGEIKGDKYTILGTETDDFDFGKAKAKAQDAIAKYPDLGCMVGLFAYNPPLILDAVREANKVGKIKIVSFDEDDRSLEGIVDGSIYGTTVQNPYKYGHKSVEILAALARGDNSVIPESGFIDIPARNIRKDNVDEFWTELKRLTATDAPVEDVPEKVRGDEEEALTQEGEAAEEETTEEQAEGEAAEAATE
ncbi:MAG: ribose transport system substrate-binding protein [Planctomycetaceae bacterium]|jgi:ribose transport system substrate-binding protein